LATDTARARGDGRAAPARSSDAGRAARARRPHEPLRDDRGPGRHARESAREGLRPAPRALAGGAPQWEQIVAEGSIHAATHVPTRTSLAEGALPLARALEPTVPAAARSEAPLEARVAALEAEVARLRQLLTPRP
jgi:hypothetical protein